MKYDKGKWGISISLTDCTQHTIVHHHGHWWVIAKLDCFYVWLVSGKATRSAGTTTAPSTSVNILRAHSSSFFSLSHAHRHTLFFLRFFQLNTFHRSEDITSFKIKKVFIYRSFNLFLKMKKRSLIHLHFVFGSYFVYT